MTPSDAGIEGSRRSLRQNGPKRAAADWPHRRSVYALSKCRSIPRISGGSGGGSCRWRDRLAVQARAGEGDRTLDIDLGKVALYH